VASSNATAILGGIRIGLLRLSTPARVMKLLRLVTLQHTMSTLSNARMNELKLKVIDQKDKNGDLFVVIYQQLTNGSWLFNFRGRKANA